MKRHCSICGRVGHDKRQHEIRRNTDFFSDNSGVHPIRDSAGYTEWLTGSMKGARQRAIQRDRLRAQARKRYNKKH